MNVNMHEAKTRLSALVEAAERGETVIISRDGEPAVMLVPIQPSAGPGWSTEMRSWLSGGEPVDLRIDRRNLKAPRRTRLF